jgi:hypothetical protein
MQEFMLYIRNTQDHLTALTPDQNQEFLKKCEQYIEALKSAGQLIAAQPLRKQGVIVSGASGDFKEGPFNESGEIMVGYYHIMAENQDEAITIAKRNPEFEYTKTARVEVRPIKSMEQTTGFVYPK